MNERNKEGKKETKKGRKEREKDENKGKLLSNMIWAEFRGEEMWEDERNVDERGEDEQDGYKTSVIGKLK